MVLIACSAPREPDVPDVGTSASAKDGTEQNALFERLLDAFIFGRPAMCRDLGFHAECDGRVADYSEAGILDRVKSVEAIHRALVAMPPTADANAALDRTLLDMAAQDEMFHLRDLELWRRRPASYEELFGLDEYLVREYAPLDQRARALLAHAERALPQVPNIAKNLKGPLPRTFVQTDIEIFRGYGEYLRGDVVAILAGVKDEKLRSRATKTVKKLADAADGVAKHLEVDELARGNQSYVLGRDRYLKLLAVQEALELPIDQLEAMAEDDLARNKRAYESLVAKGVREERPAAADLFEQARAVTSDAKRFIEERKLVTIPAGGKVAVKETPPFMRWNAAFLYPPGPFEALGLVAYYYVTLPDPKWSKKEQDEYVMSFGRLVATGVHEVYPGHFVQGVWSQRAPTRAQKALQAYSFVEGWAHYTEQLMVDEGFRKEDPQTRLGQLSDALLRDCRFVVSIGLHTKGMSLEQAEKRFVEDCKQDKATASEQAARGTFDPGYFAYTLGKLQLLALRDEVQRSLGDAFSLRAFHDAVLAHGGPPVPILRPLVLRDLGVPAT